LGDLRSRLGDCRLADGELRLGRALPILRHLHRAMRIVEHGLRDQVMAEVHAGATG
jgi:hypothetical protein